MTEYPEIAKQLNRLENATGRNKGWNEVQAELIRGQAKELECIVDKLTVLEARVVYLEKLEERLNKTILRLNRTQELVAEHSETLLNHKTRLDGHSSAINGLGSAVDHALHGDGK